MFSFSRYFQSVCIDLHSHQQCMKVPVSPQPCQPWFFFHFNHSHACVVVLHCGFYLYHPDEYWSWKPFPMFTGHLDNLFYEVTVQVIFSFFYWVIYPFLSIFWMWILWETNVLGVSSPTQSPAFSLLSVFW